MRAVGWWLAVCVLAACGRGESPRSGSEAFAKARLDDQALQAAYDSCTGAKPDAKGVDLCTQVLAGMPRGRWRAATLVARAEAYNEDKAKALADAEAAIAEDPDFADAWLERGLVRSDLKQYDGAMADFEKAMRLEPHEAAPHFYRGLQLQREGKDAQALAEVNRAVELAEAGSTLRRDATVARCRLRAYVNVELEEALRDCEEFERTDGSRLWLQYARGNVYYRLGRHRDAIAEFDKGIAAGARTRAPWWYTRGLAKLAFGDARGGEADIAQARRLDPEADVGAARHGYRRPGATP